MTATAGFLHAICIETDRPTAEALDDLLPVIGFDPASWYEAETDAARVQAFFETRREAERALRKLRRRLRAEGRAIPRRMAVRKMPREDWAESWKRFFRTERVSDRIVIRPSWETYTARPGDCVVEMDPGMSFGTGQHATTRACLVILDELSRGRRQGAFLDIGCGSGILAIAAAKLGWAPVAGFDVDPQAVRIARANARRNGVEAAVGFHAADLAGFAARGQYDLVAANLLAPLLTEHAATVASAAAPGGRVLLSGMLAAQYPAVRRGYVPLGFREKRRLTLDGWTTGCLERLGIACCRSRKRC
jgi:ribosomal protein L11 methyltransferase